MTVRVALIGAGIMGAQHAAILAEDIRDAELRVVCDASSSRARAVAEATGVDAMTDPVAAISRADIDAVLIASPDDTHAPLVRAAIGAGKPVLCEKPLAPDSAACLSLIEAERQAGQRLVQVGFMRRFDPGYTAMKTSLDQGRIGRALMLHHFHRAVRAPDGFDGQMAITNAAPHEFDISRFVLATEIAAITAFQPAFSRDGSAMAPVFLVLETTAGQIVSIEVYVNAGYGYDVKGELVGESGTVSIDMPAVGCLNSALQMSRSYPADWRPRFSEAYRLQAKDWVASIIAGRPSAIGASAWDGYCAAVVAEAGVAALRKGHRIAVGAVERPQLYRT